MVTPALKGTPIIACSIAPRWTEPLLSAGMTVASVPPSFGEPFQVVGTTHWYETILPEAAVTKCPRAPRGASVRP